MSAPETNIVPMVGIQAIIGAFSNTMRYNPYDSLRARVVSYRHFNKMLSDKELTMCDIKPVGTCSLCGGAVDEAKA